MRFDYLLAAWLGAMTGTFLSFVVWLLTNRAQRRYSPRRQVLAFRVRVDEEWLTVHPSDVELVLSSEERHR